MQDISICDDEKTEFLINGNKYSKCYVCLNYTLLLSPCECESPICDDCFNDVLKTPQHLVKHNVLTMHLTM